jgi:preprotein translocase subunit YajC
MDFIERLFGLSPDNGDGSTEILWLAVMAIVIAAFVYFRIQRRKARQGPGRR